MNKYAQIQNNIIQSLLEFSKLTNHCGMIGWVRSDNLSPEYVYGEITGYFLSFCSDVCKSRPYMQEQLLPIMNSHVKWLKQIAENGYITRCMLNGQTDWRNSAIFPFDVAMIIRGLRDASKYIETKEALSTYKTIFESFIDIENSILHPYIHITKSKIPDKWSTRYDAHFMKIVANTLPEYLKTYNTSISNILLEIEKDLLSFDDERLLKTDTHPLMYYLEGIIILSDIDLVNTINSHHLEKAVTIYKKIIRICKKNFLMDNLCTGTYCRSDVLAQFVRVGILLDVKGQLNEEERKYVFDILKFSIDTFVENGKVCFFEKDKNQNYYNVWCAMFLCQAIDLFCVSYSPDMEYNVPMEKIINRIF